MESVDFITVYALLTRKPSWSIVQSIEDEKDQNEVDPEVDQNEETAAENSDHKKPEDAILDEEDAEIQSPSVEDPIGSNYEAAEAIFNDIVDIIDRLYRLAAKLRSSTNRAPPSARNFYRDPYTGPDGEELFLTRNERDQARIQSEGFHSRRIEEIILQALRDEVGKPHPGEIEIPELKPHTKALIRRIAIGNAYRQQQFIFWRQREWERRYAVTQQVQATQDMSEEEPSGKESRELPMPKKTGNYELNAPAQRKVAFSEVPSATWKMPKDNNLVPLDETRSLSSKTEQTATPTVYEPSGRKVGWPPFPKELVGKKEFLCPYCFVTCPSKYRGKGHWR